MVRRGEVLEVRRRIGFGADDGVERFAVLQADPFNAALDTVIVAPLDAAFTFYSGFPGAIGVSRAEAGTATDQVLVATKLAAVPVARFRPAPVGRLQQPTLQRIGHLLRVLFDLR